MDAPDFILCDQIQEDLNKEEMIWTLFEEFIAGKYCYQIELDKGVYKKKHFDRFRKTQQRRMDCI